MIECIQRVITNIIERGGTQGAAYGVTTFLYDSFGSLTNETVVGVAGTNTIIRYWDDYGRTMGYALNGTRQTSIGYEPDKGRIATMEIENIHSTTTTNHYNSFSWTYLPGFDLKSSLVYPNGLTASWQYDSAGQLLQVCNATPTNVISQYDYTYDSAGRRVAIGRSGSAMSETRTDEYGYNIRGELISAAKNAEGAKVIEYQYAYDDIGNRLISLDLGTNRTYTANNLNQYTQISNLCDSASLREEFLPQFDDDGNQTLIQTSTGIWQVQYNGENRPVVWQCVSTNSPTHNSSTPSLIMMSYDRMGRRVTKNNQRFVYNGYLQIADSNGNAYIWDPTESIATRPLVWQHGDSVLYYTHDGNKNVREVISDEGEVATHYEYAPFGNLTLSIGDCASYNPWRFSSEYNDETLGLLYFSYRHYDYGGGKWMTRDFIGENAGINLFEYVHNEPILLFDSLGNCSVKGGDSNCSAIPCLNICSEFHFPSMRLLCEKSCYALKKKFDNWFAEYEDIAWVADLPDCPCSIGSGKKSGENVDDGKWGNLTDSLHGYHEGATLCMRSKPVKGHANQCCYDKCGKLITHGSGSGSADYAPGQIMTFFKHKKLDMDPADWAKVLDGGVWGPCSEAYLLRRPEKGAEKCPRNP